MANNWFRHPSNTEVKNVVDVVPANVEIGDQFDLVLTDDDGTVATISFTATAATVANVTAGLVAAWAASANPLVKKYVATDGTTKVTLTAATAGVALPVTTDTTDGGGSDTQTLVATTVTANVGNKDYSVARNWSRNAVPVATDDVLFDVGAVDVLYGLNQASVALGDFRVMRGCQSKFGRFEDGLAHYLKIDPNLFRYEGNGQRALFDLGAAAIDVYVAAFGSPEATGRQTVYLKGTALDVVEIVKGIVGIAVQDGDVATIEDLVCGHLESPLSDVTLTIGAGATITTLTQTGGNCVLHGTATTVDQRTGGTLTTEGEGAISTLNVRGTVFANSAGTVTTANVWGVLDFRRDRTPRTITTLNGKPGGVLYIHDDITIDTLNAPTDPGEFKIIRV